MRSKKSSKSRKNELGSSTMLRKMQDYKPRRETELFIEKETTQIFSKRK